MFSLREEESKWLQGFDMNSWKNEVAIYSDWESSGKRKPVVEINSSVLNVLNWDAIWYPGGGHWEAVQDTSLEFRRKIHVSRINVARMRSPRTEVYLEETWLLGWILVHTIPLAKETGKEWLLRKKENWGKVIQWPNSERFMKERILDWNRVLRGPVRWRLRIENARAMLPHLAKIGRLRREVETESINSSSMGFM